MPRVLNRGGRRAPIPAGSLLVARPSRWGNPFPLAREADRPQVLRKYRAYLLRELRAGRLDVEALRGKDLVCYCAPKPCHAELLLALANLPATERARRLREGKLPDPWGARLARPTRASSTRGPPRPAGADDKAKRRAAARVEVRNPNVPGYVKRVEKERYDAMRKAVWKVLPKRPPGRTQAELFEGVLPHLPEDLFPGGATSAWWAKVVQLDLEARGHVVREPGRPLRWRRA